MTLFSDPQEKIYENLRIVNSRFIRKPKKLPVRGERPAFALGGSAPTLVIAASNSPVSTQKKADLICFGVDDNLMFQLALQRMTDGEGGRLLVCEGDYYFSAAFVMTTSARIEGMGTGSSRIHMAAASNADMFHLPSPFSATLELVALELDGQRSVQTAGTPTAIRFDPNAGTGELLLDHVEIHDFRGDGINLNRPAAEFVMTDSKVWGNTGHGMDVFVEGYFQVANSTIVGNDSEGIRASGAALQVIGSRISDNGSHGLNAGGVFEQTAKIIVGNTFIGNGGYGIGWDGVGGQIADNYIQGNQAGMILFGNSPLAITGNTITGNTNIGVTLSAGAGNRGGAFTGNVVRLNGQHGIYVEGSHWLVEGNRVETNSQTTTNTYDGIHLAAAGDDCDILANQVRQGGGNAQRYGIHVVNGAVNNWVAGNSVRGAYGTAAYNLVDASTIQVWAGGTGDNF